MNQVGMSNNAEDVGNGLFQLLKGEGNFFFCGSVAMVDTLY
jgi:hypothetical protein